MVRDAETLLTAGLPKYEDFYDVLSRENLLNEEYNAFQLAKEQNYKNLNLTDEEIAKKMKFDSVPVPGPELYQRLLQEWNEKGITTLRALCESYIYLDVEPLLRIVEKFRDIFLQEGINAFRDFITVF